MPISAPGPNLTDWSPHKGELRPTRRAALAGLLAAGAGAGLLRPDTAHAFSITETPLSALGFVPEREGVVPWRLLGSVDAFARQPLFPEELRQLDGQQALLEGHMLPLSDRDEQREFLLAPFKAHCPFCLPGGAASFVAVRARRPVRLTDAPITLSGTFHLVNSGPGGILYRIDKASPAA